MRQVVLKHALEDKPRAADFTLIDAPRPQCPDGGVLVTLSHVSMDPYVGARLRGRHMGEPAPEPGVEAIPGHGVGVVIESRCEDFAKGEAVHLMEAGWREYAAAPASAARRIDTEGIDPALHLSALGMPGLTAWAGITRLAQVCEGETVLIDAAAGAVGGTAGQIARAKGAARVIGIAGGPEKCALVTGEYGFDACIDYKQDGWEARLKDALPDGLNVHFENVSSDILNLALTMMKPYGRAILCGLAAHYQTGQPAPGINFGPVIGARAGLHGLVVYDFYDRWDAFAGEIAPMVREGRLRLAHDIADGLDAAPAAFERLMDGKNRGKALIAL
ncbi:MAG: NADP-dependent oxidoreductase [Oceanicaulis sp.]